MIDGQAVDNLDVVVHVAIRRWEVDGDRAFDWIASNGGESVELFETAEDAAQDAKRYIGG